MAKIIEFPNNRIRRNTIETHLQNQAAPERAQAPFRATPLLRQVNFFFSEADENNGIRLTEKGFLNRKFVQAFWDTHNSVGDDLIFRPEREERCPEATRVRFLLESAGYLKKQKKQIILTKKATSMIQYRHWISIYFDLFHEWLQNYNWAYEDRYPEFEFIQEFGLDLLDHVISWPGDKLTPEELFRSIFVYPDGSRIPEVDRNDFSGTHSFEEQSLNCFTIRFFNRFCVPAGFLTCLSSSPFYAQFYDSYTKTDFLKNDFAALF